MTELLTPVEVAALLKVSKSQVYELAKERYRSGDIRLAPLPSVRIGSLLRFSRSDVELWVERMTQGK